MLPTAVSTLPDAKDQTTEYMHYRYFFGVREMLARIVETGIAAATDEQGDARSMAEGL